MLTLKRFKALTDSYGAEPERWPEAVRAESEALLRVSAEARRMLAAARDLDQAISAAGAGEDAWPPSKEEAALSRLRARVAARLGRREDVASPRWLRWRHRGVSPFTQWSMFARVASTAAVGGLIVAAGLLLGSMEAAGPTAQVDVLAMLQPSPLPFPADQ